MMQKNNVDQTMDIKIKQIFYIQLIFFFTSIIIITTASTSLISVKQIESQVFSDFHHDLEKSTDQFNYKYEISKEYIKAISSRTMIRKELYMWHRNEISIEQVRSFTQSKYKDGASVYESLLYAVRTDKLGNTIAEYDPTSAIKDTSENQTFFFNQNGWNLILTNEIIHNREIVGYDTAAFILGNFTEDRSELLQNQTILKIPKYNISRDKYAASLEIGETGFYIYGKLNQEALKSAFSSRIIDIGIQSLLILISVIVVSYFTILKLTFKLIRKLNDSALIDPLTGLSNRKCLFEKVNEIQRQSLRYNFSFALFYIDIDGFKPVNDSYGHRTGDELLKLIGSRLLKAVRSSDMVFRIGGDEFVILISRIEKVNNACLISEKILQTLSLPFEINSEKIKIGASIGISISEPDQIKDVEELLSKADYAMYEVKRTGKNNYKIADLEK